MTVISKEILEQIRPEDKNLLQKKELVRKFGRLEDCVELHIYDLNSNLLDTVYSFEEYEIPDIDDTEGFFNEITFNPDKVLRDLGYSKGEYNLRINFHRKKIANTLENLFYINTISPSRTELRVKLKDTGNLSSLINLTSQFIAELGDSVEGASYFKDFALNLGDDIILTGVNFIAEQGQNNSFLIKLYEPLPNNFNEKTPFRVIEEITNPISYKINLESDDTEITTSSTELRGPNLRIDTRLNSSIPTAYKAYNDILSNSNQNTLNQTLNILSSSIPISIEYDNTNTDSGYVYDKFIHFGSAEERLRNFKYKLELIELYESKSAYIDSLNSLYSTNVKQQNEDLKNQIVQSFDNYESYLYFEKGTFAWPKSNSTHPYINYSTSASEATQWFNTHVKNAENYDELNPYILRNTLPQYIIDNDQNEQFITFIDMVGQHFDNIWLYIENITDKNIAHNSLTEGISKDLVFNALQEKGIPAFDQFENKDIFSYLLYDNFSSLEDIAFRELVDENSKPLTTEGGKKIIAAVSATPTIIRGSNKKTPLQDISKEVWKRLYHNAPYLLKTKGTERGIKALLACYGIPESILHVKEYGGPAADKSGFRTFKYPKLQKALHVSGINTQHSLEFTMPENETHTIEFTIFPQKIGSKNIILTDSNGDNGAHFYIESSSVHEEGGQFKFYNPGASLIDQDFPTYSGRPITLFLNKSTEGQINIKAGIYIDNEYVERSSETAWDSFDLRLGQASDYAPGLGISGSFYIQNYKVYNEVLSAQTREIHTKDPNIIAGNSNNLTKLKYYAPLGANLKEEALIHEDSYTFIDQSGDGNESEGYSLVINEGFGGDLEYVEVDYYHYISTPDTVGSSMASEKVRYDQGTIDDNILSPTVRAEESTLDRQPQDFSNLGIFFSPTFEINEDIIYTLGGFRLDDYIGDPRHLNSGSYPDLKTLRDTYTKERVIDRYNFWDYLRTIQFFDHTIFKLIEEFVPVKANLKTGLVIEPHYLERNKINYATTDFSNISFPNFYLSGSTTGSIEGEYILNECDINVADVLNGSGGSFENNFVYNKLSNKYYRVAENR